MKNLIPKTIVKLRNSLKNYLSSRDMEELHDIRVCSRRLLQYADLYKNLLPKKTYVILRDVLMQILKNSGTIRNCDVFYKWSSIVLKDNPANLSKLRHLCDRTSAQQRRTFGDIIVSVKLYDTLNRAAAKASTNGKAMPPGKALKKALALLRSAQRRWLAYTQDETDKNLHALRISVKKAKYGFEAIGQYALNKDAYDHLYDWAASTQKILGTYNDLSVFHGLLDDAGLDEKVVKALKDGITEDKKLLLEQFRACAEPLPFSYAEQAFNYP